MTGFEAPAAAIPGAADTIVAAATPLGRGALSIVRLSGPRAHQIARGVCRRWPSAPRQAVLTDVHDAVGAPLDQALVLRYDAPASFTGEDCVELSTHGGVLVPTTVMAALIAAGARVAEPGEFTRRALLNGKLDILQAEATADLIGAGSRAAQRVALHQLDGGLSRRIASLRDKVIEIEALIAYDIDFPEEDDGPIPPERTLAALDGLEGAISKLLATARNGELIREGALVVLAGKPNVGKSSLFNALLGRSRAIVTPIPGTTRDALEAVVDTEPWPMRLVDTAGLRPTTDLVEQLGIEVSESYLRQAAIVLCCGEDVDSLSGALTAVRTVLDVAERSDACPLILVRTKSDLGGLSAPELAALGKAAGATATVAVSAETGAGVQSLLKSIADTLNREAGVPELDAPVLTQARHQLGVARALAELRDFRKAWRVEALPATVAAVHLHAAAEALRELIGGIDTDQILDEVFRRFCVGK
jgi:tRNA modification GTPase